VMSAVRGAAYEYVGNFQFSISGYEDTVAFLSSPSHHQLS
jgi:hypothetical protein